MFHSQCPNYIYFIKSVIIQVLLSNVFLFKQEILILFQKYPIIVEPIKRQKANLMKPSLTFSNPTIRGVRRSDFTDWTSMYIWSMILRIIIFQSNQIHGLIKFNPNPIHTSADRIRIWLNSYPIHTSADRMRI